MNKFVLYDREDNIAIITINRPERKNALNNQIFIELKKILEDLKKEDSVRAIIFKGAGDSFVSGADINELKELEPITGWFSSRFHQSVFNKIEKIGKPSIAAINGFALGGGLELAMSCSIRIATPKAKFGFPEVSLGIIPGFGGTQRLSRIVGYAKAVELILTASIIDAEEAFRIGLVNRIISDKDLLYEAKEVAKKIASYNPLTIRIAMDLFTHSREINLESGLALESASACITLASEETKELLNKFLQKS